MDLPNTEKISIIIPVYKVERYLDKCVESVLQQTYPNFEVLLIDDGSPDRCGLMCNQWAERSPLIQVIHQKNGGLADARNTGIGAATGNYYVFIDSDDYVTPDMLQKLYHALKANDADMSICSFLRVHEDGSPDPVPEDERPIRDEVLSGTDILARIHVPGKGWGLGWYYTMAWNKLYRKELFSEIRYPKGKLCEDVFVAHRLFGLCKRIACISDVCYYYLLRSGSITYKRDHKTHLHDAEGYLDRALYCYNHGLTPAASSSYWYAAILLAKAYPNAKEPEDLRKEYNETWKLFLSSSYCRQYCTAKEALQIDIISLSPALYRLTFQNSLRQKFKSAIWKLK